MLLEIDTSSADPRELRAAAAFIAALLGETSHAAIVAPVKIGTDADRPKVDPQPQAPVAVQEGSTVTVTAVVPLPPEAGEVAAVVPPPPASNGAPVAPPPGVDVDADGLPWDGRIHSEGKVKNADGKWRQKRKVDPGLVATVTAELRQSLAAPAPDAPTVTDPAAAFGGPTPAAPDATIAPEAVTSTVTPNLDGAVVPPPPPPPAEPSADPSTGAVVGSTVAPSTPAATPFAAFMRKVTALQTQGKLTTELLHQILEQFGLPPSVTSLMTRPDLIPSVEAALPAA